jgi:hypothetical protein
MLTSVGEEPALGGTPCILHPRAKAEGQGPQLIRLLWPVVKLASDEDVRLGAGAGPVPRCSRLGPALGEVPKPGALGLAESQGYLMGGVKVELVDHLAVAGARPSSEPRWWRERIRVVHFGQRSRLVLTPLRDLHCDGVRCIASTPPRRSRYRRRQPQPWAACWDPTESAHLPRDRRSRFLTTPKAPGRNRRRPPRGRRAGSGGAKSPRGLDGRGRPRQNPRPRDLEVARAFATDASGRG